MPQVVVVIGGAALAVEAATLVDADSLIIAADSGMDHALAAGLHPHVLVGDMDSISDDGFLWARRTGAEIETHPRDKDLTDTALALHRARRSGRNRLLLLGGAGDRFDHTLGSVIALGSSGNEVFETIEAHLGAVRLHVVFPGHSVHLDVPPGTSFSLIPLHGDCSGVTVTGARWPLDGAALPAASTRGLSNETVENTTVSVANNLSPNPLTVVYS